MVKTRTKKHLLKLAITKPSIFCRSLYNPYGLDNGPHNIPINTLWFLLDMTWGIPILWYIPAAGYRLLQWLTFDLGLTLPSCIDQWQDHDGCFYDLATYKYLPKP